MTSAAAEKHAKMVVVPSSAVTISLRVGAGVGGEQVGGRVCGELVAVVRG